MSATVYRVSEGDPPILDPVELGTRKVPGLRYRRRFDLGHDAQREARRRSGDLVRLLGLLGLPALGGVKATDDIITVGGGGLPEWHFPGIAIGGAKQYWSVAGDVRDVLATGPRRITVMFELGWDRSSRMSSPVIRERFWRYAAAGAALGRGPGRSLIRPAVVPRVEELTLGHLESADSLATYRDLRVQTDARIRELRNEFTRLLRTLMRSEHGWEFSRGMSAQEERYGLLFADVRIAEMLKRDRIPDLEQLVDALRMRGHWLWPAMLDRRTPDSIGDLVDMARVVNLTGAAEAEPVIVIGDTDTTEPLVAAAAEFAAETIDQRVNSRFRVLTVDPLPMVMTAPAYLGGSIHVPLGTPGIVPSASSRRMPFSDLLQRVYAPDLAH